MYGWIKLHRKFGQWEWRHKPEMVSLFVHLLLEANHAPKNWQGMRIERGQCLFGRDEWSKRLGISPQSLRTCIERLKSTNELTSKSTNRFTVLTIVNYEQYQDVSELSTSESTSKSTNNQQTTNKQSTTPKEVKKERTKENILKPDCVSDSVWSDFLQLRKKKNAPVTQTVIDGITKESGKANISLEAALTECCVRGWQSFKADWYKKSDKPQFKNDPYVGVRT